MLFDGKSNSILNTLLGSGASCFTSSQVNARHVRCNVISYCIRSDASHDKTRVM